ncbi:hypothetical protein BH10BAC2_BH10BAC2_49140 [soil metagenome]
MTLRNFISYFILTTCILACNTLEDKAKQLGDKAKFKSKQFVDTSINKILRDQKPDSFSIRSIVKDFQNDKNITEIKGIQTDNNFFYTEYCVYTGQMKRVLKGVDKIILKRLMIMLRIATVIRLRHKHFTMILRIMKKTRTQLSFGILRR